MGVGSWTILIALLSRYWAPPALLSLPEQRPAINLVLEIAKDARARREKLLVCATATNLRRRSGGSLSMRLRSGSPYWRRASRVMSSRAIKIDQLQKNVIASFRTNTCRDVRITGWLSADLPSGSLWYGPAPSKKRPLRSTASDFFNPSIPWVRRIQVRRIKDGGFGAS